MLKYVFLVNHENIYHPELNVSGIENGDWVVVTGELKSADDFWEGWRGPSRACLSG